MCEAIFYTRNNAMFEFPKQIFKKTSSLVLIADSESARHSVKFRPKIVDVRSFCVELWPKQVLHRISVPMSYISLWEWQKVVPQGPFGQIKLYWSWKRVPQGLFERIKLLFCPHKRPLRDDFPTQSTILSAQKAPAGRPSVIPKAKYMTLGPKFYFSR